MPLPQERGTRRWRPTAGSHRTRMSDVARDRRSHRTCFALRGGPAQRCLRRAYMVISHDVCRRGGELRWGSARAEEAQKLGDAAKRTIWRPRRARRMMGVMAVRGMGDGMRRTETAHDCICQVAHGLEGVLGKETKSGPGDISSEQGTPSSAESSRPAPRHSHSPRSDDEGLSR